MKNLNYWHDIDSSLAQLVKDGCVKLPSLENFGLDEVANDINAEMKGNTFSELCLSHQTLLENLGVNKYLTPKLFEIARDVFGYKGDISNQYHVARCVEPGNEKEMYRAHFDSHLFTMVLPIKIPEPVSGGAVGDLIYFPNARKAPTSELSNFLEKIYYKRFASKEGMQKFAKDHALYTDDFRDLSPLLFVGNTTLHTNQQVSQYCSSYRLTLLAHFFDPSPKYGIGGFLRVLRSR